MTIDKSLKVKAGMARSRNVLNRAERLQKLKDVDRWAEGISPLGIPKVRVTKLAIKKKKKAKAEGEEGDAAAAPAAGAKGAAAAKAPAAAAKAPAAGAKKK